MTAEIVQFEEKEKKYKCSFCEKECKPVMKAEDDTGQFLGQCICSACVKKMKELIK